MVFCLELYLSDSHCRVPRQVIYLQALIPNLVVLLTVKQHFILDACLLHLMASFWYNSNRTREL